MANKKLFKLYSEVWNPTLAQGEGEYEPKELALFDSKESAIRSIKRRKVTTDNTAYYVEEGTIDKLGIYEAERRVAYKDSMGFTDEVESFNWW